MVKNLPAMQETQVQSLGWKDPLEKEMATHSSILPGKSQEQRSLVGSLCLFVFFKRVCMGLQRVGCDWATNTFTLIHWIDTIAYNYNHAKKKKDRHGRKDWKKYKGNGDTDYVSMVRFRIIFFYQNFFISIYLLKCIKKWNLLNNSQGSGEPTHLLTGCMTGTMSVLEMNRPHWEKADRTFSWRWN